MTYEVKALMFLRGEEWMSIRLIHDSIAAICWCGVRRRERCHSILQLSRVKLNTDETINLLTMMIYRDLDEARRLLSGCAHTTLVPAMTTEGKNDDRGR